MRAEGCREWRERIGALVLGQLPDDERFAAEAHLEGCPACRAEADALAPLASLLSRADPDRLTPAPMPPPRLGERIARRIAAERRSDTRRRTRLQLGLGAAAAAAAAAVVAAVIMLGSSPSTPPQAVAFRSLPRGVSVEATLAPRPWGSDVSLQVRGFRPGTLCRVWLRRSDGKRVPAGSFRYVYDGESDEAGLSSAVAPDDATAIGLRAGSRTFVAPLPSSSASASAALIPATGQLEDT
jgi:putative zinc finger protein